MNRYFGITLATIGALLVAVSAHATDATLLPNAIQYFMDANGKPLASGKVYMYTPSTTTPKTTWTSADKSTAQPLAYIPLGISGKPANPIYGDGSYRQLVKDSAGNTIWDFNTASTGSGGGGTSPAWSEGVMVGTIISWANTTLPAKYLYTSGQAISRTTYSDLLTAITYQTNILCQTGIATITVSTTISNSIPIGAPIEASCFAPGTTVSSKSSGQLTMSTNATATISVAAVLFPWGNGDGSTTFNVPDLRGRTLVGRNNMGGTASSVLSSTWYLNSAGSGVDPNAINALAGRQDRTTTLAQLPAITSTNAAQAISVVSTISTILRATVHDNYTSVAGDAGPIQNVTNGSVTSTGSNSISVTSTGTSGAAHSMLAPSMTSDYVIKALADDSPTGPGVTSIQSMTGAISCGTNVTCTAQTISVTIPTITTSAINYTPPFTGGVTETQTAYNAQRVSVADFGAFTVLADNAAKFQAANDAVATTGGTILVPKGTWNVCSLVSISDNVTFQGVGPEGTTIQPCSNGQFIFNANRGAFSSIPSNVRIANLAFNCQTFTGVTAIKTTRTTNVVIDSVHFIGCDTNLESDQGVGPILTNSLSRGNVTLAAGRLKIWSSSDADYIHSTIIKNYTVDNIGNGLIYPHAIYLRRAVAGIIDTLNTNDLGGVTGVLIENDSQAVSIVNSYFTHPDSAVTLQQGTGVVASPTFTNISNSFVDQSTATAFSLLNSTAWTSINNTKITASGVGTTTKCVTIGASVTYTTISDNLCQGYSGSGGAFVALAASVSHVIINGNTVTNTENGITFAGTPTNIRVHGNDLAGATNKTTGTLTGTGNFLWDNLGLGGGASTTVLHGNPLGDPTYGAVANADLVNSATTVNSQICTLGSACTVTAVPSGSAGGDLMGTYPNPTLGTIISAGGPTGSATVAPIISYDAKGRLTTVSSATITPAASSVTNGAALSKVDDTNVTLTLGGMPTTALLATTSITAGWTGTLSLARGGTAANLTASNGGIFYSTASAGAILSGTATARQMLQSGANTTPAWSTTTWPATSTINRLLYSSAANVISDLATANSSVLVTDSGGIPSLSTTLPALTLSGAITYGGVTLSNAVTGTGNMVLSASPTFTGTLAAAAITGTSAVITNGVGDTAVSASTAGGYQYQLIHPTFPRTYGFAINGGNGGWTFDDVTGGSSRLFIWVSGGVGIGNTATDPGAASLQIGANVFAPSLPTTTGALAAALCWTATTGQFQRDTNAGGCLVSSARYKHDIVPLTSTSLDTVMAMQPVSFVYNDDVGVKGAQVGFIAEQMAQVDNRLVGFNPDGSAQSVKYMQMTALIVGAIQQLKIDNDNLRMDIETIKRARK